MKWLNFLVRKYCLQHSQQYYQSFLQYHVTMNAITLATIYLFITRVTLFILNAYSGFTTGRSAVETKKLSILNNIDNFLARFIENVKKGKEVISNG